MGDKMTVNHKNGVTYTFYLFLAETLIQLNLIKKKAEKDFKPDIKKETCFLIKHIENYIEKNKTWLKG